jgi:hypothetical protein
MCVFKLSFAIIVVRSQGCSVSVVSDYGLDDRGSILSRGESIFPLASVSRPAVGPTQPPVQWVPGVPSQGRKTQPRSDTDHSPPSSYEIMNE